MCVFSGPVSSVSRTRIFGRLSDDGIQYLVYQMEFSADDDVAMILPFPCDSSRGKAEFINLEEFPDFFKQLDRQFPSRLDANSRGRRTRSISKSIGAPLEVHRVGAFEGSFVPTINDFDRLDKRFRLPEASLDAMKQRYGDFSFAVFKLTSDGGKKQKVHPMAFKFPSAQLDRVFFPTLHIHDGGDVPRDADYDHSLYIQVPSDKLERDLQKNKEEPHPSVDLSSQSLLHRISGKRLRANQGIIADAVGFRATIKQHSQNTDIPWLLTDEAVA